MKHVSNYDKIFIYQAHANEENKSFNNVIFIRLVVVSTHLNPLLKLLSLQD